MAKFQPGQSGNLAGRPKGSSLHSRLKQVVGDRFDELVEVILQAALAGDMSAANLLVGRLVPALRPIQEPMSFTLEGSSLTEKAMSVLNAIATAQLSTPDGKALLDAITGLVRIKEAEEISQRLERLEWALKANSGRLA